MMRVASLYESSLSVSSSAMASSNALFARSHALPDSSRTARVDGDGRVAVKYCGEAVKQVKQVRRASVSEFVCARRGSGETIPFGRVCV